MIGSTLAHYRITASLGKGGMGEVWRAEDTKLGREVALKVLPEEFASDPDRYARFEREARVLASLNHPNIAHLYGLETVECAPDVILSEAEGRPKDLGGGPQSESESSPLPDPSTRRPDGRLAQDDSGSGTESGRAGDPASPAGSAATGPASSIQHPESGREGDPASSIRHPASGGRVVHFLVMELVEGEELSERIQRGAVPIDEAIPIALQIAEALEAAHEQGIVHRDLKPANIKLTSEGVVKVLDFGLAKAWEDERGDSSLSLSPTLTRHATVEGVILGTAAYMSPEQARGKKVDRRADIWAYGVVLWEMLTRQRLFDGETVTDVLAAVLTREPDLSALPGETPASIKRLLSRCFQREPKNRLQWIGDARLDLVEAADYSNAEPALPAPSVRTTHRGRERLAWAIAVIALAAAAALWLRPAPTVGPPLTRFTLGLGENQRLSFIDQPILAFSPDGRTLAMTTTATDIARDVIALRELDRNEVFRLDGTEGAGEMFFSPDGSSIAFFADGKLKRTSVSGGSVVTVADAPNPRGGVWLPDGTIVYSPEYASGIWRVADTGGPAEEVVGIDDDSGERTFRFPDATPDGEIILFTVGDTDSPNNYDEAFIAVYSSDTGTRRNIIEGANMARFVGRDRIVFARRGDLFSVRFDPERLEAVGEAVPVIEDVGGDPSSGAGYFTIADNGNIAWLAGAVTAADTMMTVVDTSGRAERLPLSPRGFFQPRFSPDGTRLAFTVGEGYSGVTGDVWVYSLVSNSLNRLTFTGNSLYPLWYPDGDRIAFLSYSDEVTIEAKAADGSSAGERLFRGDATALFPESVSPDGGVLAVTRLGQTNDIYLFATGKEPVLFEDKASGPAISPDGRWLAYSSPGSGSSSVFVRPLEGAGKWQVSPDLGGYPRWSRDGRRLFYIDIGSPKRPLMAVDVAPGDTFVAGPPEVVLDNLSGGFVTSTAPSVNWDVAPSGDRFVFVEFERRGESAAQIEVALNWAKQLDSE